MKIAVLGERFIDRYFIGTSTRQSPEVPEVPVVNINQTLDLPGGAGNVSANLVALGVTVDRHYQSGHYPIKNRLISDGPQIARWDQDDYCAPLSIFQCIQLGKSLHDADGLIISDYGKGMFSDLSILKEVIPSALPVFIDTKQSPKNFIGISKSIYLFPNISERMRWEADYTELENTYEVLVIQKKSKDGIYFQGTTYPSLVKNINNVSGAGDTTLAAFAYSRLCTHNIVSCIKFALAAAAVVCEKPYTATASRFEINDKLNSI